MYKHYPHHDPVSIAPLLCCCALSLTLLLALFFPLDKSGRQVPFGSPCVDVQIKWLILCKTKMLAGSRKIVISR